MGYARRYGDPTLATGAMSSRGRLTAIEGTGDDALGVLVSRPVLFASSAAMAYHGYKRTGSVIWALLYSALGPIGLPIALAQGWAKKKGG